jgi:hypothetical protein
MMLAGHDHHYVELVWLIASAFGVAALAVLVVVYRRASRRHELEQAEAIIAEHDQLESPHAPASDRDRGPRL